MELLGKELVQCAQSFDLKGVSAILITHPPPEVLNFQNNVHKKTHQRYYKWDLYK